MSSTLLAAEASKQLAPGQWTPGQARAWYEAQPWLVGCNFLPSTAVNDVEMWQQESFDAATIDRELGWAEELGFNTVRVFVNYAVWEADPAALKKNFDTFLAIARRHGIATLVILFDDCFLPEPAVGKQPDPEPGVHNSRWVQSPGARRRDNAAEWTKLEQYVKDVVGAFAADPRVLAWELYNEPTQSLPLVESAFAWAREAKPTQPVTATLFGDAKMQERILALSDVICFHNYGALPGLTAQFEELRASGRPVFCTEWMARTAGSRFETHLPFLRDNKIACWCWGLVTGRTQTRFPWGSPRDASEPTTWFHDILRPDGTPFRQREVCFIKVTTGKLPASAWTHSEVLVPTAEHTPVPWRYTFEQPGDDWCKPGFDDKTWQTGAAPFGREETPIARRPNTQWTGGQIWLRREFELPSIEFKDPVLLMHHDEDAEVYLNGGLAAKAAGFNAAYEPVEITPESQASLKPGKNLIAVHCRQTGGGQYFDVGLEAVLRQASDGRAAASQSDYRGWKSIRLANSMISLHIVPEIGGRVIQFAQDGSEFLWVNPKLAGKEPPASGLADDGSWLNYGGDKLWPAPQGWDGESQWPGPPDAVLDGQPYRAEMLSDGRSVRLTSRDDSRSGIRFSRIVRVADGTTRVSFQATMTNIDTKPRRWGIWAHTQLDGAKSKDSAPNSLLNAWCPLNPKSRFPKRYSVIFGDENHPSFQVDSARNLMRINYRYKVGKIGIDSDKGWIATVNGEHGSVFVQRFQFDPKKEYPDGSSVEYWLNGVGRIRAFNRDVDLPDDPAENPYVFESELLSPFAALEPGQAFTWKYEWCACNVGGEFPVLDCTDAGVTCEPLWVHIDDRQVELSGRFGVFAPGQVRAELFDADGRNIGSLDLGISAAPQSPVVLDAKRPVPRETRSIAITLCGANGQLIGELARSAKAGG
jgi:hypothetical protein